MKIGKYEVVRQIGKGGMSEVFEVEDTAIGSRHALKIYTYAKDDPEVRNRFLVEGRLLARLSHPGIVKVTDIGSDGDRPYFVMDLILGPDGEKQSLADVPDGSADEETIGRWYDDIRSALAYIHSKGVVHRDLKLQNVMIGPDSRAVLADFGISRIFRGENGEEPAVDAVNTIVSVRDGRKPVMGSLGYMAPELEMGAAATPKSDWYALGVLTYKLLTGTWCDSRTDIVSTLETYSPAWQTVIPPLLHSNPDGRECLSFSETKETLREKAEAEAEKTLLEAERRRKRAGVFSAVAICAAIFAAAAAAAVFARLSRVNAKLADAKSQLAIPVFSKVFAIPATAREDSEGLAETRHDFELAQVDAWVLTHKYFDGMAAGEITPSDALEALKAVQRKVIRGEEDELLGDEYDTVGENEPLKELFKLAVRKTAKAVRRYNRIAGRPVASGSGEEQPADNGENE